MGMGKYLNKGAIKMYKLSTLHNTRYTSSIRAELRASHAGETGAVWIYRGILLVNRFKRDSEIETFAKHHLATEKDHLIQFENLIHRFRGSALLLIWILAGFMMGALSMMLGRNWVYYTIYKVESFVDIHYRQQINALSKLQFVDKTDIIKMMERCNADEQAHRDEALNAINSSPHLVMRVWGKLVETGSHCAVVVAKLL
jgi:ubiquinone biosynthesis monooxygenase Coq7